MGYLYKKSIRFLKNENIDLEMPYSDGFLANLSAIASSRPVVHHSHTSGKIVGFVHEFCNLKVRENYYTIPVIAHNQFRFDFFLILKGIRPTVWETTDIKIEGKNASNINFAAIANQVRFIDTTKYFQQSLAGLAESMNDEERRGIRDTFARVLQYKLLFCTFEEKQWILEYLAKGKGTIPYQKFTQFESLLLRPPSGQDFFSKDDFYSTLREKGIEDEDYEEVKKFFKLLNLQTLGELNKYYNIQDTLILCEIFEQRSDLLQRLFKFNPRKCNSASAFSGYVHRNKSKCNIVLPLDAEIVRVFEKTLIGGYSCINTRLAFDTKLFLKDVESERVLFHTGQGNEVRRFSSKIIKMDENNQYGFAMTKPLPYGCIKKKKVLPTLEELEQILNNVTLDDKLGHLFVVDIVFDKVNEKTLLFNELYPPIFEKNKKIEPYERSCAQIMCIQQVNDKGKMLSLKQTTKTHATLKKKIFVPLYAEDLYFLTTRAGWTVTQIYKHYTFKQDTFKKNFVVMNQDARKAAKTKVEKDFYKLLNNSNFGYDCRNNIGNCNIELLYDGVEEIKFIKKYTDIFSDYKMKEFFTEHALRQQIDQEIDEKTKEYEPDDEFYDEHEANMEALREEELEAIDGFLKWRKKRRKNENYTYNVRKIDTIENEIEASEDLRKNKMLLEFNEADSSSAVKQIAVKSQTSVRCTTRFLAGKMLMFAKLSLKSFVYDLAELLTFPGETVQAIYDQHQIERVYVFHILTDTDSTSMQFIVVSKVESTFTEPELRSILFEIFSKTDISRRFDKSDDFWKQFNVHDSSNKKVLGLYEVESIDDPCLVTLAVNPKEYFEYFQSQKVNKKHKGIKKGAPGMNYENYSERVKPLYDFESFVKPKKEMKKVVRFSVKKGEMTTHQIEKNKFSQINDKRFYFPNAIVSLPFGHGALKELDKYKKKKGQKIEAYFLKKRQKLLELERQALIKCSRLKILDHILLQSFKVVHKNDPTTYLYNPNNQNVVDFILEQGWLTKDSTPTPTMDSSKET